LLNGIDPAEIMPTEAEINARFAEQMRELAEEADAPDYTPTLSPVTPTLNTPSPAAPAEVTTGNDRPVTNPGPPDVVRSVTELATIISFGSEEVLSDEDDEGDVIRSVEEIAAVVSGELPSKVDDAAHVAEAVEGRVEVVDTSERAAQPAKRRFSEVDDAGDIDKAPKAPRSQVFQEVRRHGR
jgi:hypothetical protein